MVGGVLGKKLYVYMKLALNVNFNVVTVKIEEKIDNKIRPIYEIRENPDKFSLMN
jgi:hypothetical protein